MWNRATKIKVLVGIFAAVVLVVGLAIWLAIRCGKLPDTAGRVMRSFVESMPDAEQAKQELEGELEKIRAAGEPMTLEEIIPPEVPDEENAALLYQKAFEKLDLSAEDKDVLGDLLSSMARPPRREAPPMQAIEQIVAKNAAAIALLEKAAQWPKCRFPVNWSAGADAEFPHYPKLRTCARVLAAEVVLEVRRGEASEALDTVQVGLAMCEAIRDEPTLISQLVRYALVQMLLRPLHVVLEQDVVPTASCRGLFDYLQRMEFMQSFVHSLWGERVMNIGMFDVVRQAPEQAMEMLVGADAANGDNFYATPGGQSILT